MKVKLFGCLLLAAAFMVGGCAEPVAQKDAPPQNSTSENSNPDNAASKANYPSPNSGEFNPNGEEVGLAVGNLAPEITGEDLDGISFNLSDYRGKVVMLDFWGDW